MKLLVLELNSFHLELLPMYERLVPSLFGGGPVTADYFVLPAFVEQTKSAVGGHVHALNIPALRFAFPTKRSRALYYRWKIQRLVDQLRPRAVIFNTVEPPAFLQVFRRIQHPLKIGVVHNPRRPGIDYHRRGSGELIFCLHDYNYQLLQEDEPVDGYLSPFYRYLNVAAVTRAEDFTEIAVQGVISFNRRDYPMLVDLSRRLVQRSRRPPVIFNILGDASLRDGPRLQRLVQQRGVAEWFRFHVGLPDREFFGQLARAHYVMPLLKPDDSTYAGSAKVTLAYGHSGAYGVPLILHRRTATVWGIPDDACVTYDKIDDLADRLVYGLGDRAALAAKYRAMIATKIEQNRVCLQRLARQHPAFATGLLR